MTIEQGYFDSNTYLMVEKMFSKNWFYKPWDFSKTQGYYQSILGYTGSAKLKHFYYQNNQSDSSYSTYQVNKILNPSNWEHDLSKHKTFPH